MIGLTSDFIIKLDIPKEIENEGSVEKLFYVHSTVLGSNRIIFEHYLTQIRWNPKISVLKLLIFVILFLKHYFYSFILTILKMLTSLKIGLIYYMLPPDFQCLN